jgi:hypothetical protein
MMAVVVMMVKGKEEGPISVSSAESVVGRWPLG